MEQTRKPRPAKPSTTGTDTAFSQVTAPPVDTACWVDKGKALAGRYQGASANRRYSSNG